MATAQEALAAAGATGLAAVLALAFVPVAIRVARHVDMLDRPSGWKEHRDATPYLGGVAVLSAVVVVAAILVAAGVAGDHAGTAVAILVGAVGLCVLGTLDDTREVPPYIRVLAEAVAGAGLWLAEGGFRTTGIDVVDLALTVVWIVGVVNALNLIDLLDGSAGSVTIAAAVLTGLVALVLGAVEIALLAGALAGATAAFLRFNLSAPSRIFLGDGGSMPIGFLLGAGAASLPWERGIASAPLGAALLLAVPLFDMMFRIVLRLRRGISLLTGGPDSLANRLLDRVGTKRRMAVVLGATQAGIGLVVLVVAAT